MAKVLVLEADTLTQLALESEIRYRGLHEVKMCLLPRVALEQVVRWKPDIILADYGDVDGGWLCREVKKLRDFQQIPVIIMSRKRPDVDWTVMWHRFRVTFGCDGYVHKSPLNYQIVIEAIDAFLWLRGVERKVNE